MFESKVNGWHGIVRLQFGNNIFFLISEILGSISSYKEHEVFMQRDNLKNMYYQ